MKQVFNIWIGLLTVVYLFHFTSGAFAPGGQVHIKHTLQEVSVQAKSIADIPGAGTLETPYLGNSFKNEPNPIKRVFRKSSLYLPIPEIALNAAGYVAVSMFQPIVFREKDIPILFRKLTI